MSKLSEAELFINKLNACNEPVLTKEGTKHAIEIIANQLQEIERLNNIINELEKWLKERLETLDIIGYDDDIFNGIELALYKLQELKGDGSNENL